MAMSLEKTFEHNLHHEPFMLHGLINPASSHRQQGSKLTQKGIYSILEKKERMRKDGVAMLRLW